MEILEAAGEKSGHTFYRRAANFDATRLAGQIVAAAVAPVGELRAGRRRTAHVAFARQNAMYLAHVALGLSYTEVGRAFGRDRTTAAHACRVVEDRRTDPAFDARLALLEHLLRRGRKAGIAA